MKQLDLHKLLEDVTHIIFVFAHPDDEVVASGGLSYRLHSQFPSIRTTLVCFTSGEASTLNYVNSQNLAATRKKELHKSAEALGFSEVIMGDLPDGELKQNKKAAEELLSSHLSQNSLGICFEPGGLTGHPDHQAASQIARKSSNRLLYATLAPHILKKFAKSHNASRLTNALPSHRIYLTEEEIRAKRQAIAAHPSQWGVRGEHAPGVDGDVSILRNEYFFAQSDLWR